MPKAKRSPPVDFKNVDEPYVSTGKIQTQIHEGSKVKINFAGVSSSFEPRAAGEYEGTLVSHEINPASASSGQPTVTLKWSENDSPNRFMFRTYSLQPKALWSLKRDLIRIGADVAEMNSEDADLDDIITKLYGYSSTLKYGDPRPGKDKEGNDRLYDNFLEIVEPAAVSA